MDLATLHLVFYVSLLMQFIADHASIVPLESVGVIYSMFYKEDPMKILDRQAHRLRNKKVVLVKVL